MSRNQINGVTSFTQRTIHRNLPRALALAVMVVTVVNVMTNLAYFVVVPPSEMASSDAVAVVSALTSRINLSDAKLSTFFCRVSEPRCFIGCRG